MIVALSHFTQTTLFGWTLSNWDFTRTGVSGDADFTNEMTTDSSPFDEGDTMYTIYNTLYTVAKEGLIESDPTTSDWEQSKVDLANGKVAVIITWKVGSSTSSRSQ